MNVYRIPLTPEAQSFNITLNNVAYKFQLQWNVRANVWMLDMLMSNGTPFIMGLPLITNVDLIGQYTYLNIGGKLVARSDADEDTPATYTNLGINSQLYFIVP